MLLGVWDTLKLKRRKERKQRPFGLEHWAVSWSRNRELKERAIFGQFLSEFQREQDTKKRELQLRDAVRKDREKHSEHVREWKRKKIHFFFGQVTHKEDKLMEFSWSFWVLQPWRVGVFRRIFCYWFCGEIVFTLDLFVVYLIYCEHKFNINLIIVISIS